ncbi:MAG: hypothetical protein ACPG5T_00785 [Endozoicomonas sp.]
MKLKSKFHFILFFMVFIGANNDLLASVFYESGIKYLHKKTDSLRLMLPLTEGVLNFFMVSGGMSGAGYGSAEHFQFWQPSPLNLKSSSGELNESDEPGAEQKTVVETHSETDNASRGNLLRSPAEGGGHSVSCGGSGDDPDPNDNRANYDRPPPKETYPDLPVKWLTFTFWGGGNLFVNYPKELLLLNGHSYGPSPGWLGHIVLHHHSDYCMPYIQGPIYNRRIDASPLYGSVAYQFVIRQYNLDVVLRKKNQHWVFAFTRHDASLNVIGNVIVSLTGAQGGLWQYRVPAHRINQLSKDQDHSVVIDDQTLSWFSNEEALAVSFGTTLIRPFDTGDVEKIIEDEMVKHDLVDKPVNDEGDPLEENDPVEGFKKMELNRNQSNDSGYGEELDEGASRSE